MTLALQVKCIICILCSEMMHFGESARNPHFSYEMKMIRVESVLSGLFFGTLLVFKVLLCEIQVWEQRLPASCARLLAVPQQFLPVFAHLARFRGALTQPLTGRKFCQGPREHHPLRFPDLPRCQVG